MIEAEVRQSIDQRLKAKGWIMDPSHEDRNVFLETSVINHLSIICRDKLGQRSPDYTFFLDGNPIAVLEAKKPSVSIQRALKQGLDYANCLEVDFVFACNGPVFKSLYVKNGDPLYLNNIEIEDPLAPAILRKFQQEESNKIITVPNTVIDSREKLIRIFERLNDLLRDEGIRAGLDRFTEFANILFLKLASESRSDETWNDLLYKNSEELQDYINNYVVPTLRNKYKSDVLSKTDVSGNVLKKIITELNPLHLLSVDEDLKGVAFEYFLSRTTNSMNDLGEYFTPRSIVKFMVKLLNPQFREKIYDPFCGTGGFLIEGFRYLSQQTSHSRESFYVLHNESVYGKEITTTARIAKMNMILFGDGHSNVEQGNSLNSENFNLFDCVLSNIPFSLEVDSNILRSVDQHAGDADEACFLRCFNSLKTDGRLAIIIPEGLFVNNSHKKLWFNIFNRAKVRAVVTLSRGTFAPYTGAGAKVILLTNKENSYTDWYYHATISGHRVRGKTISLDEFLFFYKSTDLPSDVLPSGIEVVKVRDRQSSKKFYIERPYTNDNNDTVRLETIAVIKNGEMLTKAQSIQGPIPIIGGGRVSTFSHNQPNYQGQIFTVSKSGAYAGYVWWHENPIWASDCLAVTSRDEEEFLSFYIYLCLLSKQEEIYARQQGTGQPHIYEKHIKDFPIPVLSIEEQYSIIGRAQVSIRHRIEAEHQEKKHLKEALDRLGTI